VPIPAPGELLLKLRVVGFCGTDLFKLDTGAAQPGMVLGHEVVGEVVATGKGVRFKPGERVAVPHHVACGRCVYCERGAETMCETFKHNLLEPGGFAERILVKPRATALAARALPANLSDDAAVFMEPAACVLRGIDRSAITKHGVAVVLGAGSMGLLHLLVLKAALPEAHVICVDPVPQRRQAALDLGACAAVTPGDEVTDALGERGQPHGADAVFDTVGGTQTLRDGLALTRQGGSVVLFAHAPEGEQANFDINTVFKHERRIVGTYSGGLDEQARVFSLMSRGIFDPTPLVTHHLPLDRFDEGVTLARERKALKVLFTPTESAS
jgi:L-iditol 2-dehydrogenase